MIGNEEQVSFAEIFLAVDLTRDAFIMLLAKKGIVTHAEVLQAIKEMNKAERAKKGKHGN